MTAFSLDEIDRGFGDSPGRGRGKAGGEGVLAERRAAWDALDKRLGYSRARQADEEAFALQAD